MKNSPTHSLYFRLVSIPVWIYGAAVLAFAGALVTAPHTKFVNEAQAAEQSVSMVGMTFSPTTITIATGDIIVWTNNSSLPHTVTADDGSFDSGTINAGGTYSHTFMTPGTYHYYCRFHGAQGGVGMSGTIIVTANQAANTNPPQLNNNTPQNQTMPMQMNMNPMPNIQMNANPQTSYQQPQQQSYSPSNAQSYSSSNSSSGYSTTMPMQNIRGMYTSSPRNHVCHSTSYSYPNFYPQYQYMPQSYYPQQYSYSYGSPYNQPQYSQTSYQQPSSYSSQYSYPNQSYYGYPQNSYSHSWNYGGQ